MNPLRAINADVRAEAYRAGHADGDHTRCKRDACDVWVAYFDAVPEDKAALDRWSQR